MIVQTIRTNNLLRPMLIAALCFTLVIAGTFPNSTVIVPDAQAADTVIVVPNAQASSEGNSNNGFPFNVALGNSIRYQQVYAASDFSGLHTPMLINEIRFRPDGNTGGGAFSSFLPQIEISLSTTQRTPGSLSTTFADNVGPDDTIVFARGPIVLSSSFTGPVGGPKSFDIVVTFTTPFLYDPSQGNLLLDVRNFAGGFTRQFDAHFIGGDSIARTAVFNSLGSPTGFTDSLGLVTAFNFISANASPVAACQDITIPADGDCLATIAPGDVDTGSYDPDAADGINLSLDSAGPFGVGSNTVTLTVTDDHNAASSCQATVTVVDATAPSVSCPANIVVSLPLNATSTGTTVNYTAPTATDNCSAPTVTTNPESGSVFPVGTTTISATAVDGAGGESACNFTVTVLYNFLGFFQPVDNPPFVNMANAGSAIPVKFSLSGNKGLNIFAAGYPVSQQIACVSGAPLDVIEQTITAGGSSLSYDPTLDQYVYVWKTDKSWKGTCRQLILNLNDGTTHTANFQFK